MLLHLHNVMYVYLECPNGDADHESDLNYDDTKLSDRLRDEYLCHVDPCDPGTIQKTFVSLHHKRHSCQSNGDTKSDAALYKYVAFTL